MDSSYNFPQDDYALAILTHAAMQTTHTSETSSPSYSGSRNAQTRADGRASSSTTTISNHQNDDHNNLVNNSSASNLSHSRTPDLLSEYNTAGPGLSSSRSMETLGFNQTHSRQNPYMTAGYHGIGAQISANYASTLGILNAESYDDGRGTIREQSRFKHQMSNNTIPFGMVESNEMGIDLEVRANSEEFEKGTKRKKKRGMSDAQNEEDEDEARKKARGRPRVDTKDETAADVSTVVFSRAILSFHGHGLKNAPQNHPSRFLHYHVISPMLT
jgi:hypothetical protein